MESPTPPDMTNPQIPDRGENTPKKQPTILIHTTMKKIIESVRNNVMKWLGSEAGAGAVALMILMMAAWLLGWIMGHAMGGVTQIFEQSAYGMHGATAYGFQGAPTLPGAFAAAVVAGVAGVGRHIDGTPLTTNIADTVSPGLLRN